MRRYGSEPPATPGHWAGQMTSRPPPWPVAVPGVFSHPWQQFAMVELPEPPLPPVAGELRARLEALESQDLKANSAQLANMRSSQAELLQEFTACRNKLSEKTRLADDAQRELVSLRLQLRQAQQDVRRLEDENFSMRQTSKENKRGIADHKQLSSQFEGENRHLKKRVEDFDREQLVLQGDLTHLRQALKEREQSESDLRNVMEKQNQELQMLKAFALENDSLKHEVNSLRDKHRENEVLKLQIEELKARHRLRADSEAMRESAARFSINPVEIDLKGFGSRESVDFERGVPSRDWSIMEVDMTEVS